MTKRDGGPACNPFALIEQQMEAEGRPKVIAWGFACGRRRELTPKQKARAAFLARDVMLVEREREP